MDPARALADATPAPYWLDRAERPRARSRLVDDSEADLVVVGGGFTGLWAALQAIEADPGRSVVLLEGNRIADGASGRNGGFLRSQHHPRTGQRCRSVRR